MHNHISMVSSNIPAGVTTCKKSYIHLEFLLDYECTVHADLIGDTDLKFTDSLPADIDVLFLCVAHGEAIKFLQQNKIGVNL